MTNKERYLKEISDQTPDYKTTIKEFTQWLTDNSMTATFKKMLRSPDFDDYDIGLDFSIPISMVKHFRKTA